MSLKRQRTTARAAVRNISRATTNAGRAVTLATGAADVIAHRISGPASGAECTRMVFEKVLAAQTAWWGLGAAMMTAGPKLARSAAPGRGPFAVWEAAAAVAVQSTAALIDAQRAVMTPMWTVVRANKSRLAKNVR